MSLPVLLYLYKSITDCCHVKKGKAAYLRLQSISNSLDKKLTLTQTFACGTNFNCNSW